VAFSSGGDQIAFHYTSKKTFDMNYVNELSHYVRTGDQVYGPFEKASDPASLHGDNRFLFSHGTEGQFFVQNGADTFGPYDFVSDIAQSPEKNGYGYSYMTQDGFFTCIDGRISGPYMWADVKFGANGKPVTVTIDNGHIGLH